MPKISDNYCLDCGAFVPAEHVNAHGMTCPGPAICERCGYDPCVCHLEEPDSFKTLGLSESDFLPSNINGPFVR